MRNDANQAVPSVWGLIGIVAGAAVLVCLAAIGTGATLGFAAVMLARAFGHG